MLGALLARPWANRESMSARSEPSRAFLQWVLAKGNRYRALRRLIAHFHFNRLQATCELPPPEDAAATKNDSSSS
jgi:hypothetical protein